MRELTAGEQKDICGIDDLGLQLKQSFNCNFAEDRLLIFLFERDYILLRLHPRALLNGEGPQLEILDICDLAETPDIIETMLAEAITVPYVVKATLIELALDEILKRASERYWRNSFSVRL